MEARPLGAPLRAYARPPRTVTPSRSAARARRTSRVTLSCSSSSPRPGSAMPGAVTVSPGPAQVYCLMTPRARISASVRVPASAMTALSSFRRMVPAGIGSPTVTAGLTALTAHERDGGHAAARRSALAKSAPIGLAMHPPGTQRPRGAGPGAAHQPQLRVCWTGGPAAVAATAKPARSRTRPETAAVRFVTVPLGSGVSDLDATDQRKTPRGLHRTTVVILVTGPGRPWWSDSTRPSA